MDAIGSCLSRPLSLQPPLTAVTPLSTPILTAIKTSGAIRFHIVFENEEHEDKLGSEGKKGTKGGTEHGIGKSGDRKDETHERTRSMAGRERERGTSGHAFSPDSSLHRHSAQLSLQRMRNLNCSAHFVIICNEKRTLSRYTDCSATLSVAPRTGAAFWPPRTQPWMHPRCRSSGSPPPVSSLPPRPLLTARSPPRTRSFSKGGRPGYLACLEEGRIQPQ